MARVETDPSCLSACSATVSPFSLQLPLVRFRFTCGTVAHPASVPATCVLLVITDPLADLASAFSRASLLGHDVLALYPERTPEATEALMARWCKLGNSTPLMVLECSHQTPLRTVREYLDELDADAAVPIHVVMAGPLEGSQAVSGLLGAHAALRFRVSLPGRPDVTVHLASGAEEPRLMTVRDHGAVEA